MQSFRTIPSVHRVLRSNCCLSGHGVLSTRRTRGPLSTRSQTSKALKLSSLSLVRVDSASTRLLLPDTLMLTQAAFKGPGDNFLWRGYPSQMGKWGLCIDCKAGGTVPTDHLEIIVSGAKQVRPDAPSVRRFLLILYKLRSPRRLDGARCSLPQALTMNLQTVLLYHEGLGSGNHTITLTNLLDDRFNATGPLTLEFFQVTYEGMGFDTMDLPVNHIYV
jgi:hypothetical protein